MYQTEGTNDGRKLYIVKVREIGPMSGIHFGKIGIRSGIYSGKICTKSRYVFETWMARPDQDLLKCIPRNFAFCRHALEKYNKLLINQ